MGSAMLCKGAELLQKTEERQGREKACKVRIRMGVVCWVGWLNVSTTRYVRKARGPLTHLRGIGQAPPWPADGRTPSTCNNLLTDCPRSAQLGLGSGKKVARRGDLERIAEQWFRGTLSWQDE